MWTGQFSNVLINSCSPQLPPSCIIVRRVHCVCLKQKKTFLGLTYCHKPASSCLILSVHINSTCLSCFCGPIQWWPLFKTLFTRVQSWQSADLDFSYSTRLALSGVMRGLGVNWGFCLWHWSEVIYSVFRFQWVVWWKWFDDTSWSA